MMVRFVHGCGSISLTVIATLCPLMTDHSLGILQWRATWAVSCEQCCDGMLYVTFTARMYTFLWVMFRGISGTQGTHMLSFSEYCQSVSQSCTNLHENSPSSHNVHNGFTMSRELQKRSWYLGNFLS